MDSAFSLRDIQFLAAVRDIVTASDRPLHLSDLKRALLDRGVLISHGAPRANRKKKTRQRGSAKDDVSDLSRRLSRLEEMLGRRDGAELILCIRNQGIRLAPNAFDLINDLERNARLRRLTLSDRNELPLSRFD